MNIPFFQLKKEQISIVEDLRNTRVFNGSNCLYTCINVNVCKNRPFNHPTSLRPSLSVYIQPSFHPCVILLMLNAVRNSAKIPSSYQMFREVNSL